MAFGQALAARSTSTASAASAALPRRRHRRVWVLVQRGMVVPGTRGGSAVGRSRRAAARERTADPAERAIGFLLVGAIGCWRSSRRACRRIAPHHQRGGAAGGVVKKPVVPEVKDNSVKET